MLTDTHTGPLQTLSGWYTHIRPYLFPIVVALAALYLLRRRLVNRAIEVVAPGTTEKTEKAAVEKADLLRRKALFERLGEKFDEGSLIKQDRNKEPKFKYRPSGNLGNGPRAGQVATLRKIRGTSCTSCPGSGGCG
ncbi:hypothetical protein EV182_000966 [Spiromyces aspiralis]|uniref:Uncharacterized protein n=1 Tax=Spiromyces aspiralis TaxID=68401 RepID=A0ACC1HKD0_9FUNG|nr:hypothetical protein EV182_000966 [Spiromyces aspiralis]